MGTPGNIDVDALRQAIDSLLRNHPEAAVAAIGWGGLFVPMPDTVPLAGHVVLEARSALDIVEPSDRVVVIATWERMRVNGAATAIVRLSTGSSATLQFFDCRELFDVCLGVVVPTGDEEVDGLVALNHTETLPPRLAHVRKNEISVITEVDAATTRMFGWSPSELVGKRSLDFIHPDDQERAINSWMEMLTAPGVSHRVRLRHKRRDGSWLWVEIINHNLVDDPAHKDVKCEVIDVSDEMAAHEALRVREQLLRRLTETLPNGVLQIDGDRRVLYANERLCSIIGTSTSATVDAQFANVVSEDRPAVDRALDAVLVEAQDVDVVVRVQASPTEHRICEMSFRVLTSDDGAVSGAIVCVSDVTESSRMRSELEIRATFDQLTGCHNRESILTTLDATLARTEGPDAGTAAIFVDLDRFKPVNDRFGHAAGDRLLEAVAARLREAVRVGDLVGRVGGDEFLVVCPDVTDPNRALEVGERIASALREPVDVGAGTVVPSGSIGVAWSPRGHADADALVAVADAAMYESKRDGAGLPRLVSIEADAA